MAGCIVQLHCMTGCDANSGFYGKGKKLVFDQMVKNHVARRHVIYGDNKSSTIAEDRAAKWKRMNNKSFICLLPDADS